MSDHAVLTAWEPSNVLRISLNRPEKRNAIDASTVDGLVNALESLAPSARAIVLTGTDRFFSAGGDVSTMPGPADGLYGPASRLRLIHEIARRLRALAAPSIAAVEGYAIGAGWGLALACDLIVAAKDASFAAPFAQRGLSADAGVAWHLTRRLGRHRANRHLLLGEPLNAGEALAAGLVSHVVPPGTALDVASELAAGLAEGPQESNAVTRWMSDTSEDTSLATFLHHEEIGVSLTGHGQNATEGRRAFSERRSAVFYVD